MTLCCYKSLKKKSFKLYAIGLKLIISNTVKLQIIFKLDEPKSIANESKDECKLPNIERLDFLRNSYVNVRILDVTHCWLMRSISVVRSICLFLSPGINKKIRPIID